MKIVYRVLVLLLVVLLVICGVVVRSRLAALHKADSAQRSSPVAIEVAAGETLKPVLSRLEAAGAIDNANDLYIYARLQQKSSIRSGNYSFKADISPLEILGALHRGNVVTREITIPEGRNRWEVRDQLASAGWLTAVEFDRLCDDQEFLRTNEIPGPTCEGYIFPETYSFARGVPAKLLLETFFATYRKQIKLLSSSNENFGPRGFDERQFVTLASIVEKETGTPVERGHIACVFYNRLAAKPQWRLETDPTVIYAARLSDPNFDGNLKRFHLRKLQHPYNTYKNFGLPPGPIANPGAAALAAVLAPPSCGDFFFVSKNNGEHVFCPTLDCHRKQVQRWQIDYFRRRRKSGG